MQRFKYKTIGVILSIVLLATLLAGCGGGAIPRPGSSANIDLVQVNGECTLMRDGDTLTVTGETDLINGSIIHVSIVSQDGMELDSVQFPKEKDEISQTFTISEKYNEGVEMIYAFITCAPQKYGKQEEHVYHKYGESFQYIDNPVVPYKNEEGNVVMQEFVDEDGNKKEKQAMRSLFQWNSEGLVVTFMSDPIEM